MSRFDDEPLSPEERALADRLARLGPHDGPSAALDAKILAAAHAAVAGPARRRRRLGLTAIPGGLITGAGMAAALVLVIGTVWQLRPSDPAPRPARGEGDGAYVSAEIIERRQQVVAPPPPAAEAPATAKALNPPPVDRAAVVAQRKATAAAPAAAPAPLPEEAPAGAAPRIATVGPDEHPAAFRKDAADARSRDAFAAPAAAPVAPREVQAYSDAERGEAFQLARARQQRSDEQTVAAQRDVAASVPAAASAAAPASAEPPSTLDRVEVTGSRLASEGGIAATPVVEDARLEPAAWLERIRERRDAGNVEDARESLAQFRKAYPRVRLPRDLRALAQPATTR